MEEDAETGTPTGEAVTLVAPVPVDAGDVTQRDLLTAGVTILVLLILIVGAAFIVRGYQDYLLRVRESRRGPNPATFREEAQTRTATMVLTGSLWALGFSVLGVLAVIWIVGMADSDNSERAVNATLSVFNTILPVLAAWVGVVLAFYFSTDAFRTAAQETRRLVSPASLDDRLAGEVMTPVDEVGDALLTPRTEAATFEDLLALAKARNIEAFLMLTKDGHPDRVVTKPELRMAARTVSRDEQAQAGGAYAALAAMSQEADFVSAREIDSMVRLRTRLRGAVGFRDVVVTEDGTPNSAARGWIRDPFANA